MTAQTPTFAELRLLEASAAGVIADFTAIESAANPRVAIVDGDSIDSSADDGIGPANQANRPSRAVDVVRTDRGALSANLVRTLLTRNNPAGSVTPAGVLVVGARITGAIELARATIEFPIAFVNCHFDQDLVLRGATARSIFLGGSDVPGIDASSLHVHGDVQLCDGFRARGPVRFDRAIVDGNLSLNGAQLDSGDRIDLPAGGTVSSSGALFDHGNGCAFLAEEVTIRGHLLMSNGFHSVGEVDVRRAHIGGMLYCSHGRFENPGDVAIAIDATAIDGDVVMSNGFIANGEVSIRRAHLRRHLYCLHGTFKNPGGNALTADSVKVDGRALLGDWFSAQGAVRLCDAKLKGDLYCVGGIFQNSGGDALCANGLNVGGNVRMHTRFLAQGAVRLAHARIAGALNCDGGHFENAGGVALSLEGAEIGRNAIIGGAFRASGTVSFSSAKIGGTFDTEGPKFDRLIVEGISVRGG